MALVALEDPAPLVDLSENTQGCSPQYEELGSQGLLETPRAKVTREASPQ